MRIYEACFSLGFLEKTDLLKQIFRDFGMKKLNIKIMMILSSLYIIYPCLLEKEVLANETTSQSCIRWDEFTRGLPSEGGTGGQWKAFRVLPPEFQSGCTLLQDNNSIDIAYILKAGISPDSYIGENLNLPQKPPSFNHEKEPTLDQMVNGGKAMKVTWLTPTQGSIPYLNSIPSDRAFYRDDGMTCFRTICMQSGSISHQSLVKILEP